MAVGKGSMARAAKTATKTAKQSAGTVSKEEVSKQIVYEKNQGMLERDAEPNERFGVGDAMPVYYF